MARYPCQPHRYRAKNECACRAFRAGGPRSNQRRPCARPGCVQRGSRFVESRMAVSTSYCLPHHSSCDGDAHNPCSGRLPGPCPRLIASAHRCACSIRLLHPRLGEFRGSGYRYPKLSRHRCPNRSPAIPALASLPSRSARARTLARVCLGSLFRSIAGPADRCHLRVGDHPILTTLLPLVLRT